MKSYTVAIIGCGRIGADERATASVKPGSHLGAWLGNPRTKIVGLVDPSEENLAKARNRAGDVPCFKTAQEMFAVVTPDIVSVATPSALHMEQVLVCTTLPIKAIVCEKPLAMNHEDGEKMIAACREKDIMLIVNHMRRFDQNIRETKRRLAEFGPIMQAQAIYARGIYNNGTHLIDLLRFFLGEAVDASAVRNDATATYTDLPGDCNVDGMLTFANGARASVQSLDGNGYSAMMITMYGKNGRVTVSNHGFRTTYEQTGPCETYPGFREIDELHAERVGEPRSFFAPMAEHVVACLDGTEQPLSTGEDALGAVKTIDALVLSAKQGGTTVRII